MVLVLFGVHWAMPKPIVELFACWQGWFGCHRNGCIWIIIPHCLRWCIWMERNNRSFEDTEGTMPDLKLFLFRTLFYWLSALKILSLSSVVDLLDSRIFVTYCLPQYTFCILGWLFYINKSLLPIQKKKKHLKRLWVVITTSLKRLKIIENYEFNHLTIIHTSTHMRA